MNTTIGEKKLKAIVSQLFKDLEEDPNSVSNFGHEVTITENGIKEVYCIAGDCHTDKWGVYKLHLASVFLVDLSRDESENYLITEDVKEIEHLIEQI